MKDNVPRGSVKFQHGRSMRTSKTNHMAGGKCESKSTHAAHKGMMRDEHQKAVNALTNRQAITTSLVQTRSKAKAAVGLQKPVKAVNYIDAGVIVSKI